MFPSSLVRSGRNPIKIILCCGHYLDIICIDNKDVCKDFHRFSEAGRPQGVREGWG